MSKEIGVVYISTKMKKHIISFLREKGISNYSMVSIHNVDGKDVVSVFNNNFVTTGERTFAFSEMFWDGWDKVKK